MPRAGFMRDHARERNMSDHEKTLLQAIRHWVTVFALIITFFFAVVNVGVGSAFVWWERSKAETLRADFVDYKHEVSSRLQSIDGSIQKLQRWVELTEAEKDFIRRYTVPGVTP